MAVCKRQFEVLTAVAARPASVISAPGLPGFLQKVISVLDRQAVLIIPDKSSTRVSCLKIVRRKTHGVIRSAMAFGRSPLAL